MVEPVDGLVANLFRHEAGRMVSTLTRVFGISRMGMAEDVVQETLLAALQQWRYKGVPENPTAWLYRVAKNRALDLLRHKAMSERKLADIAREHAEESALDKAFLTHEIEDDQLRMIFTCCHPALTPESQVALTLKTLCGLSVTEIARAFLTDDRALAQRLVRAKKTLKESGVLFEVPEGNELADRLDSVLKTLYLLFSEGYNAHDGDLLIREELCAEAIRLAELLARHSAGNEPKVFALLALMYFQASRLPARTDSAGDLLLLQDQDRSLWDRAMISRGYHYLQIAGQGNGVSVYHLEAGIASCHAAAESYDATNWPAVLEWYDALLEMTRSPVVALNRAVALSMVDGPPAGIAVLAAIQNEKALQNYYLLPASLAQLYEQAGDHAAARYQYERALSLAGTEPEFRFLKRRMDALNRDPQQPRALA